MILQENSIVRRTIEPLLVFLLSSFGATYFFMLFMQDLKNTHRGTGVEIATLKEGDDAIKRKSRKSLLWSPVETGAPLFLKDAISVGPTSHALIETKDRALIEVGPDSLIQLNDTKDFTANFVRGTFIVRSANEDTKFEIKNGSKKVEKISARLLKPAPGSPVYAERGQTIPVNFEWSYHAGQTSKGGKDIFIEISKTKSFSHPERIKVENVHSGRQAFPLVHSGNFYWRLVEDGKSLTEVRTFRVLEITPPRVNSLPGATVSWAGDAVKADRTYLEYQDRAQTEPKRLLLSSGANQISMNSLEDGTYSVRLIQIYGDREFRSSPTQVVVQKAPPYELSPIYPTETSKLDSSKLVHFIWKTNNPKIPVVLQIERDSKTVLNQRVMAQSFLWKNESLGKFRWKITPENKEVKSEWIAFERPEKLDLVTQPTPPVPAPQKLEPKKRHRLRAPKGLSVEVE